MSDRHMTTRSPLPAGNSGKNNGQDLGWMIAVTGGFAFAVASCLAVRDAVVAEIGLPTVLPFVGAVAMVLVGLGMQRAGKGR